MASNVNDIMSGTGFRFEFGRPKEARRVFQRVYPAGLDALSAIQSDVTIPRVGNFHSNGYLQLRCADITADVISLSQSGESIVRIIADYIDTGYVHIQFSSTTATISSPFDIDGNRVSVTYNGDEYLGRIEIEESRTTMQIERVVSLSPYQTTLAAWIEARENKCNDATFLGQPARCWRIAQIDAELLFETYDANILVDRTYRVRFFVEMRPARDLELTAGAPLTTVAGWDQLKYYEVDGNIPADAVVETVQTCETADFSAIFAGITF